MLTSLTNLYRKSFEGLSKEVWLLSLVMLINRSGAMVLPFLSIYLIEVLGFTMTQSGVVMATYGIGSVVGVFIGGELTDRIGYYPTQFWSLISTGLIFFVVVWVESFLMMCGMIFILTTFADLFRPANIAAVAAFSKPENRTRSISLIRLAINLGYAVGPAVGGFIVAYLGYHWLFWVDGVTCISAAIFFRLMLTEKKEVVEPEAIEKNLKAPSAYRDKPYLVFILMNMILAIAFLQIISAMPVYFRQAVLLTEIEIGWVFALNGLLIAFLEMPIVYVFEKKYPTMRVVIIGAVLIGCSFLIFNLFGPYLPVVILSIIFITFGEILNMPFANSYAMNRSEVRNRGQYMALWGMSYSVAFIIGPMISMYVAEQYGFTPMWHLMATFCAVAIAGFFWVRTRIDDSMPNKTVPGNNITDDEILDSELVVK